MAGRSSRRSRIRQGILTGMKVIDRSALAGDPLDALRQLAEAGAELDELRRQHVEEARRRGATWENIANSLGVSRQTAWETYSHDIRQMLDETIGRPSEDTIMPTIVEEVSTIRRHRRHQS